MVVAAMDLVGVRYRRGGVSADTGFDCSGFTRHVFETSLGLLLPRRVDEQAAAPGLVAVKRDDLRPGDLVFFNTLKRTFSHVGIYIGDNRFIHSPRPGKLVRTDDISFAYWSKRFTGARRVQLASAVAPAEQPPAPSAASSGE
jgi:cell wall-associated NlpC family hydrolase